MRSSSGFPGHFSFEQYRQSNSTGQDGRNSTETTLAMTVDLCSNGTIDTIFNSAGGETFIFRGEYYWKFYGQNKTTSYPKLISERWLELPGDIDAAFTYRSGKTYFFKGSKVWRYIGTKKDKDFPKDIKDVFPGIPDDIDAVTVWGGNGKIYFFKGSKFWRFDPFHNPHVSTAYPKPISNWEGVPDYLDAAYQSPQGLTYFFKAGNYYRINDEKFAVDSANPPFPRDARHTWFGCNFNSTAPHLAANSTSFLKADTAAKNSTNSQPVAENRTTLQTAAENSTNSKIEAKNSTHSQTEAESSTHLQTEVENSTNSQTTAKNSTDSQTAVKNSTDSQTAAKNSTRPRTLFSMISDDKNNTRQDSG
ncbi:hypothetical protein LSTR_LSTR016217, partial [Laodelphax striatellus]